MNTSVPLYPRVLMSRVREAMKDTPVIVVNGPRQAGKTTLVRQFANEGVRYITLDDEATRISAGEDPVGLVRSLDRAVIDEVQRSPELLLAIKKSVDSDRRPGRFLLTGSANVMTLPKVSDSLAGRMEVLTLLPLSQGEIHGHEGNWVEGVFAGIPPEAGTPLLGDDLVDAVLRGGYPEAVRRYSSSRRRMWIRQYVDAMLKRDVRDIANVDDLNMLPRFMRALAEVSGEMCNYSQLGGRVGLSHKTAARYIGIFEQMYLLKRVEPWGGNRLKRMVKTPKMQFLDSGILSTMMGMTRLSVKKERTKFGNILESFVYSEICKHVYASEEDFSILYYRDRDKVEVDLVLEDSRLGIVGVEIKGAATVRKNDLRGLLRLREMAGDDFRMGVLLYDGLETLPLGPDLWAIPLSTL